MVCSTLCCFHRLLLYQPNHSVDDMRVQILEKIYHSSGSPSLSSPLRRERELFWIKELGTAKPYGFNDQIKGVGTFYPLSGCIVLCVVLLRFTIIQ